MLPEYNQSNGNSYKDGVLTSRNTFQKYYTQKDLRDFIAAILDVEPIPACPGVFYVFKNDEFKEEFLASRIRRTYIARSRKTEDVEAALRPHENILKEFANSVGSLGRMPKEDEFDGYVELREKVGSPKRCLSICELLFENFKYQDIRQNRIDDLLTYIALSNFGKQVKSKYLPLGIKRDIREFFGSYEDAIQEAKKILFSVGNQSLIDDACKRSKIGKLLPDALYVHREYINSLDVLLRVYIGCGTVLAGEMVDANIIKIMRKSKEISFLTYEDFDADPHPKLLKSQKIYFKNLAMAERNYTGDNRPILHRKETLVDSDYAYYDKFKTLTSQEEKAGLYEDVKTIGFSRNWDVLLKEKGYKYKGHKLLKIKG